MGKISNSKKGNHPQYAIQSHKISMESLVFQNFHLATISSADFSPKVFKLLSEKDVNPPSCQK